MTAARHAMWIVLAAGSLVACSVGVEGEGDSPEPSTSSALHWYQPFGLGYNVHLTNEPLFEPIQPGSDADAGRALFGLAPDLVTGDATGALFEGPSFVAQGVITGNGRTCFTCHRGADLNFGLPAPPLMDHIDANDVLFAALDADAQGDPDGADNLNLHGLIKYRPNRFNQARSQDDPLRQVFFWRKSPSLLNVGLSHGFLLDGRGRAMLETARGAIFSHTQPADVRFDDLFTGQAARDMTAFLFGLVTDPDLLALRDPSHPLHDELTSHPFATVDIQTWAQWRGKWVFRQKCMVCHDAPNVFNHRATLDVLGTDGLTPEQPVYGPHVGRSFNVGVSERNRHGLRFTREVSPGVFEPITIPLAGEDGSIDMHTVTFDIGLAATTGRSVDVGRFKVPQLRNIRNLGPYFHDNSADTLEEVVDYFTSDWYNNSPDGRRFPIHLSAQQRADLLAFLYIL